ncbi:MAG: tetratricopeptide repeat protein [Rhodoferax sp.]
MMHDADTNYKKALIHLSKGEVDHALPLLEKIYASGGELAPKALFSILYCLTLTDKEAEGIALLRDACLRYPKDDRWPAALASAWMKQGDLDKALACADQALAINPDNETMFINRVCWLAGRCEDPVQSRQLFESWGRRFMDPLTDRAEPLGEIDKNPNRRLKLAYISGDFKNHSVRYFIEPFLKGHDRSQFEVHAFMTMPEDEVTGFLKPWVDVWHNVESMKDHALLSYIREQKIDILVDLSGHTEGHRLAVLAMRAAPVQVTWFGFMQTLGMKAIDWRLTDWGASPAGTDSHYTEKLYRLDCMAAYAPPLNTEAQYPSPYQRNGFVTMVSMNHTRKLGHEALQVWRDILLDNPQAGLIVIGSYKDAEASHASLAPRLIAAGLPMERVSIAPRLTMLEFMGLASVADFALDSFPISGGTTTLHALWMGLPILALEDPQHGGMSSSTWTTLRGVQMHECVATSLKDYRDLASQWIQTPSLIDQLRERCRPALAASVLMDHTARVHDVENAYRDMWRTYMDA